MGEITAPAPIGPMHRLDDFDCGVPVLNEWLKRQALPNEALGASRTFVVCTDLRVAGYYARRVGPAHLLDRPSMMVGEAHPT